MNMLDGARFDQRRLLPVVLPIGSARSFPRPGACWIVCLFLHSGMSMQWLSIPRFSSRRPGLEDIGL